MKIIHKKLGETPLQALENYRLEAKIEKSIPMTYAGRLDPMAEGALIILIGKECKEKQKYNNLDKEYEVEILLGLETDTYDLLGLFQKENEITEVDFKPVKFIQEYPKFSSKRLFKEDEEEIPTKEVEIYKIENLGERDISKQDLENEIKNRISLVKGDFRQDLILEKWNEYFSKTNRNSYKIVKIKVLCSSGTYMRSLANSVNSLAFSIKRTRILV